MVFFLSTSVYQTRPLAQAGLQPLPQAKASPGAGTSGDRSHSRKPKARPPRRRRKRGLRRLPLALKGPPNIAQGVKPWVQN